MIKKNVFKVLFISLMFSFAACSSDDANDDNGGVIGGDHTYDIQLVGESETIHVSGAIPSISEDNLFTSVSNYFLSDPQEENQETLISMFLLDNTSLEGVTGTFALNDNRQSIYPLSHPDENDNTTRLSIRPAGSHFMYHSISGTLSFSNVRFSGGAFATGFASYTLNFEGVFQGEDDNTYQGSGTIVFNPKEGFDYD